MLASGTRAPWTFTQVHSNRPSVRQAPIKRPPFHHGRLRQRFIKPFRALDPNEEGSELDPLGVPISDQEEMSSNEWDSMQRVCDKLFPKGTINWEQFWMNDDFEDWYDDWQQYLQEESTLLILTPSNTPRFPGSISPSLRRIHRWSTSLAAERHFLFKHSIRLRHDVAL